MIIYIAAFIIIYLVYFYWNVSKYPLGPFPIPIFGNALQMAPNNLQADLERWRVVHGNVFTIWLLNRPIVVLMRTREIKEAVISKAEVFINRTGEFPEDIFQSTENGGVIFSNGDSWREQRRTSLHILKDFGFGKNIMEDQIHHQLDQFVKNVRNSKDKDQFEFRWPIQILIANVINQLLYNFSYPHDDCERLMNFANRLMEVLNNLWESFFMLVAQAYPFAKKLPYIGYISYTQHVNNFKAMHATVESDVKDALKNYSKEDEPNCFVQAYYQKMDTNPLLNLKQLNNVCFDFFMAGMETTSTTLRWSILYLAEYQDKQEKVRREIAKVVGFDRLVSMRDRNKLPYTTAYVNELQRCANIVSINLLRKTNSDVQICEKYIPAGTNVLPHVYGANLDEIKYNRAYEFNPERFIKEDGKLDTELVSELIPFGTGKRQCVGEPLAKMELFLGLATIIQNFKISPSSDREIDFEPIYGVVLMPKPIQVRVEDVDPLKYF